jgi:L-fuconolactonase
MGRLDPDSQDALELLSTWRDQPGMLGIRMLLNTDRTRAFVYEPQYEWFWSTCQQYRIPLMLFAPSAASLLETVSKKYPELRIIADHAARHPRGAKDEAAWSDIDALLALAARPNVAVKVSSLPSFSTAPYPFPVLHRPIKAIYDAFGAERMIWGSDATRLTCPYKDNIRLFTEALDFLSSDDIGWIMGKSARRWCDWPSSP